jgi:hypothetical protein
VNFVEGCKECQRLSAAYEAATMDWFRLQGQLRIAEYSVDDEASDRIVAEIKAVGQRRQSLRDEIERHNLADHARTTSANGKS